MSAPNNLSKLSQPVPPTLKEKSLGFIYCSLWYLSILLGFYFMFAPLLVLLFFNRPLYRRISDSIVVVWEAFNVSLLEVVLGMKTFTSGDPLFSDESSLIIMNHRTRVDWNFLWSALFHANSPPTHNAKLVLKNQIRKMPGIGWAMQMSRCMYINRCWKSDEPVMERMLSHYSAIQKESIRPNNFQLILFPEGTNLTPETKKKSDAYAMKQNLKPLNHLLHPRTTGFTYIANKMREHGNLDAIYDITVAYPDNLPDSEIDMTKGKVPKEVHFYIKRYDLKNIPTTLIGLEKWLQELWRDKDQLLDNVYKEGIRFPAFSSRQLLPHAILPIQYMTLAAWFGFMLITLTNLFSLTWTAFYLWTWIAIISGIMFVVSKYTDGLQEIEVQLEKREFWPNLKGAIWKKATTKFKLGTNDKKSD